MNALDTEKNNTNPLLITLEEKKESEVALPNSKSALKETIGDEVKEVLHCCAALNTQLGKLQIELAALQKKLFDNVTLLIDNTRPYKKATRDQLQKSTKLLQETKSQLESQVTVATQLKNNICKDPLLSA